MGRKALDQYDAESNPDYCNHTGWSSNRLTVGAGRSWNGHCTDRSVNLCVHCTLGDCRCIFAYGSRCGNLGTDSDLYDSVSGYLPAGCGNDHDSVKSDCSGRIHETVSDCVSGNVPLGS